MSVAIRLQGELRIATAALQPRNDKALKTVFHCPCPLTVPLYQPRVKKLVAWLTGFAPRNLPMAGHSPTDSPAAKKYGS